MLDSVRYSRENGEIEFRIVDCKTRFTLLSVIIKCSAYGGYYFHAYKTSMTDGVFSALKSVDGISSVIQREGGVQCHTLKGIRDGDMHTVERFYYIIPGGVDEMMSYIMEVVNTYCGDNYIER